MMDRKEYLEERKTLLTLEAEAYRSFDKTLLTVSAGAVALSMTFLEFPEADFKFLLIASWILWLITIFLQLISSYISPKALREEQIILNEQYKDDSKKPRNNKFLGKSSSLNFYSLFIFALATITFITFVIINFNLMQNNEGGDQKGGQKGSEVPVRAVTPPPQESSNDS